MKKFSLIVAESSNHVIGDSKTNNMLWHYKKDMAYFKSITSKVKDENLMNALIMGYNTWKSIGEKGLKGRLNIIIDRTVKNIFKKTDTLIFTENFTTALLYAQVDMGVEHIFVIGGGNVYRESLYHEDLKYCFVTRIKKKYEGDVTFPKLVDNFYLVNIKSDIEKGIKLEFCVYEKRVEKSEEYQYLKSIEKIIKNGHKCEDRTGTGTLSLFGEQMRWDLRERFPLLTTKRMFFRGIVEELLWFLRGDTDNKKLQDKKIHIWDGNTSKEFLDKNGLSHLREGDAGAVYGFQFRHFGAKYIDCDTDYTGKGYDQVKKVIEMIKENPNSRRIVMSLWNPPDLSGMALPPCLFFYQFRVYGNELHCHILNRSNDMALGNPWNIATGALMTYIIAHLTGLTPGDLVHSISDAHLYLNHVEPIKEQLSRRPFSFPILNIKNREQVKVEDYVFSDFELLGYECYPSIKMDMAV